MTEKGYLVAVDAPLKEALTYLPPEGVSSLERGASVTVPLGKRTARGIVLKPTDKIDPGLALKPMLGADHTRPLLPPAYMDWLEWLANYYVHPLGQIVETVFPPLPKEGRGSRKSKVVNDDVTPAPAPHLTVEQSRTVEAIQKTEGFAVHLIHGVTGSGKTEVYLRLLDSVVKSGKQGLVLVPEIALTPQLIDRFSRRFPGSIAVLHSHLTEREKTDQWWSVVEQKKKILIGARSALFCPLMNPGIIILDEEHEPSYKQDEKLKYHARDAAIILARNLNIPIVLGSATPSLESWSNAQSGKYQLHTMRERAQAKSLPDVEVIDLREVYRQRKETPSDLPHWLSDTMFEALEQTLSRGDQAALFLNRRGMAQTAQCQACGYKAECPNCSVALTLHASSYLVCHYCDYSERASELCPECKEAPISAIGLGTEKIEAEMARLFPNARLARADRDEIQSRDDLEKLIADFESERTNLLIGTQMIAKGLDFPKLNFVGLILADLGFHFPDFRASERSFQLLTQVSGRAGRQTSGRVLIQTYNPNHPSISYTLAGDYLGFAEQELNERRELLYPPFGRMALFRIQSAQAESGNLAGKRLVHRAKILQNRFEVFKEGIQVLGPAPAPLAKLRGKFRYQIIIKCDSAQKLNALCRQILSTTDWIPKATKVQVDIDPFQMM